MVKLTVMLENQLAGSEFVQNLIDRVYGGSLLVRVSILILRPRIPPGDKQHIWRGFYTGKTLSIVSITAEQKSESTCQLYFKTGQWNFSCGSSPDMAGMMSFDLKFFAKEY